MYIILRKQYITQKSTINTVFIKQYKTQETTLSIMFIKQYFTQDTTIKMFLFIKKHTPLVLCLLSNILQQSHHYVI